MKSTTKRLLVSGLCSLFPIITKTFNLGHAGEWPWLVMSLMFIIWCVSNFVRLIVFLEREEKTSKLYTNTKVNPEFSVKGSIEADTTKVKTERLNELIGIAINHPPEDHEDKYWASEDTERFWIDYLTGEIS